MRKVWGDEAWEDYLYWQEQDKKTLKIGKGKFRIEKTQSCTRIIPGRTVFRTAFAWNFCLHVG